MTYQFASFFCLIFCVFSLSVQAQRTEGMASYYADRFHGKPTSTGEAYNKGALTAASKDYPVGTILEVTEVTSGRNVKVRVNDCGPHSPKRIIDLSRAAAAEIGLLRKGVARVRLKVVDMGTGGPTCGASQTNTLVSRDSTAVALVNTAPATPPAPKTTGPAAPPSVSEYAPDEMLFGVQVASFRRAANAESMVAKLHESGFDDAWSETSGNIHRVYTGRYYFQDEAAELRKAVREAGFTGAVVRRVQ